MQGPSPSHLRRRRSSRLQPSSRFHEPLSFELHPRRPRGLAGLAGSRGGGGTRHLQPDHVLVELVIMAVSMEHGLAISAARMPSTGLPVRRMRRRGALTDRVDVLGVAKRGGIGTPDRGIAPASIRRGRNDRPWPGRCHIAVDSGAGLDRAPAIPLRLRDSHDLIKASRSLLSSPAWVMNRPCAARSYSLNCAPGRSAAVRRPVTSMGLFASAVP